ncbi:MAG: hypothetical protein JWR10_961 [Rubritepida sp.]|nr:hypothetical protein [Rubritepida sp.]
MRDLLRAAWPSIVIGSILGLVLAASGSYQRHVGFRQGVTASICAVSVLRNGRDHPRTAQACEHVQGGIHAFDNIPPAKDPAP